MTRIRETRTIPRPLSEVFDFISRFETVAHYDPGVRTARRLSPDSPEVGTRFAVDAVFMGRTLPMVYQILDLRPEHSITLRGEGDTAIAVDHITFEEVTGGTRVTWTLDLTLRGMGRISQPLMRPLFRRLGRKALDGLSEHLGGPSPAGL